MKNPNIFYGKSSTYKCAIPELWHVEVSTKSGGNLCQKLLANIFSMEKKEKNV